MKNHRGKEVAKGDWVAGVPGDVVGGGLAYGVVVQAGPGAARVLWIESGMQTWCGADVEVFDGPEQAKEAAQFRPGL